MNKVLKILVLDDDKGRLSEFRCELINHVVDCVETVPETINCLSKEIYDLVFLDHDLGGKQLVPSGPGTGFEVTEWLRDHPDRRPKNIIIHTLNTGEPYHGAENMIKALPEDWGVFYLPGAWGMNLQELIRLLNIKKVIPFRTNQK
jgi:CheY-like chemotaxis protein